jgi:hypothetical protein
MTSLRKCIDKHCRSCIYDSNSAGNWRQQVTLCSVKSCALREVRPKTTRPIPESVLSYYGVKNGEYEELKSTLKFKPDLTPDESK